MALHVASRRRARATVEKEHPGAEIIDVTSRADEPWVRFSPFYPHGGIPVPLSPGRVAQSVEGVWQALKVFAAHDVDPAKLEITNMRGLKRTVRAYGPVKGHRAGLDGTELLPYEQARREIYLPTYRWVLEHRVRDLVEVLREREHDVVLLDYTTNGDVGDTSRPLSHAALLRDHVGRGSREAPEVWP
ncbi:hypothetical protein BTM25_10950 [Actinomadura rubteroloni]|uniref:Uncharacterized protein n=1 Tax=Actinomadura rubteroloni TaxID=1926885 RepID=A0A2P4UNR9_9ACTN|nr:hypothetical protein [Actinomadura rubteroloni]POM26691.1 hypothetical protein BTM25_10950 [Actinomadura rubteroloni]